MAKKPHSLQIMELIKCLNEYIYEIYKNYMYTNVDKN